MCIRDRAYPETKSLSGTLETNGTKVEFPIKENRNPDLTEPEEPLQTNKNPDAIEELPQQNEQEKTAENALVKSKTSSLVPGAVNQKRSASTPQGSQKSSVSTQPKEPESKPVLDKSTSRTQIVTKSTPKSNSAEEVKVISFDDENKPSSIKKAPSENGQVPSTETTTQTVDQPLVDKESLPSNSDKDVDGLSLTPTPQAPPKVQSGTVSVAGDVEKVRIENNGRDVPLGSVPIGEYVVYATFQGFNEFKVTTFSVKDGGEYTIFCVPSFATCKIK